MNKTYRDKMVGKHVFTVNKEDNGGEAFSIETKFFDNGDGLENGLYLSQLVSLQSYCNSATFDLSGACFTPEILRQWANELDGVRSSLVKS